VVAEAQPAVTGMLEYYVAGLGLFLVILGALETLDPRKAFDVWKRWTSHRFFPVHGALIIAAGFPLTLYEGFLSGVCLCFWMYRRCNGPGCAHLS
jgi:hypothetical protein